MEEVKEYLRRVFRCVRYESALKAFLFDELVNVMHLHDLRPNIVENIREYPITPPRLTHLDAALLRS